MTENDAVAISKLAMASATTALLTRIPGFVANHRTDLYVRTRKPITKYSDGSDAPQGTTVTNTFPVVGWATDGTPMIAIASSPGATVTNGAMVPATALPDYELYVAQPATRDLATADHAVVEVITGSDEKLRYTLPDGTEFIGVVPLWGRRGDGSLVALLTAEVVPTVRTIERDETGEIVGVVEQ